MNSKFLKLTNKIIAITIVILICSTSVVSAFSFELPNTNGSFGKLSEILGKIFNSNSYKPEDLKIDFERMKELGDFDLTKIKELIGKLGSGELKDKLSAITNMFPDFSGGDGSSLDLNLNLSGLLDMLLGVLGGNNSLDVEPKAVTIESETAYKFTADTKYKVKLNANIYMNEEESDKWLVLIHPFLLNGKFIANSIAPFYLEKGYNIIAPDLRGFGDSEGSVALGFLESLDIYDWLCYLEKEHKPQEVIIHGVSLGAATTNFVSGIDQFMANGPTKMELKSLRELNVIGLVEDCGYTDMEQFAGKKMLIGLGIGLTNENFDYYSKATNSLKYCDLPILIIHGTGDTTVKPQNATTVANTVKGEVTRWEVKGGVHAFIIMGSNKEEYKNYVQTFINKCESTDRVENNPSSSTPTDKVPEVEDEKINESTSNFVQQLMERIKNLFKK